MKMPNIFHNNLKSVKVDTTGGDFSSPLLSATKFPKDGQSLPEPQGIYDTASNDQRVPTGEKIPIGISMWDIDPAQAAAVKTKGRDLEEVDIQVVTASTTIVYKKVIPNVLTKALAPDGKIGAMLLEGDAVAYGSDEAQTVTTS